MCGIFFSLSQHAYQEPDEAQSAALRRRGPDSVSIVKRHLQDDDGHSVYLTFVSTVLSLRGSVLTSQPLVDEATGSVLCWNGEAWRLDNSTISGNDTQAVFERLLELATMKSTVGIDVRDEKSSDGPCAALSAVEGPYSFVFYDAYSNRVIFGRDPLGRRSLLSKCMPDLAEITIASVIDGGYSGSSWLDLEYTGIYVIELDGLARQNQTAQQVLSYKRQDSNGTPKMTLPSPKIFYQPRISDFSFNGASEPPRLEACNKQDHGPMVVLRMFELLKFSLQIRLHNVPKLQDETEDAARVAVLFSGGLDCTLLARIAHEVLPAQYTIDLINVAFENPRVIAAKGKLKHEVLNSNTPGEDATAYEMCPDRITGRSSYKTLQKLCSGRTWNFVAANIRYSELEAHRARIINLMYPKKSEMDLSISCALYFAARGSGTICAVDGSNAQYSTPARVLLSGFGADELFGGYGHHAKAFAHGGYEELVKGLKGSFHMMGDRNLARDDRIISDWGKEVRYPFLDEAFVKWTLQLPVWEKCNYGGVMNKSTIPDLPPDKHLLRRLAWDLGMPDVAREKKRAMQFGSRSAKMDSGRTKGTDIISPVRVSSTRQEG